MNKLPINILDDVSATVIVITENLVEMILYELKSKNIQTITRISTFCYDL